MTTLIPSTNRPGGYTTEVDYERVFFSELTPHFLNYVALINCIRPVSLESGFNYCDLGCGHGVTPTVLAAANPEGKFGSPVSMVISKSYDTDLVGVWQCQTPTIM